MAEFLRMTTIFRLKSTNLKKLIQVHHVSLSISNEQTLSLQTLPSFLPPLFFFVHHCKSLSITFSIVKFFNKNKNSNNNNYCYLETKMKWRLPAVKKVKKLIL